MKKRAVFLFILIVVFASLVSAEYFCSDGSEILKSSAEIDELARKSVNGIGIGVIKADEQGVTRKISADLLVDAKKVLLSNKTRAEEIKLESGTYTVTLVNATDTNAKIKIGGTEKTIEKGAYDSVGDVGALIVKSETKTTEDIGSAEIIVGSTRLLLTNYEKPRQIVTLNKKNYLIELISASYNVAIVSVSKCETGNLTEKIEQIQETGEIANQTTANETQEINESNVNLTEVIVNQTIANETSEGVGGEEKSILKKWWFWLPTIILAILVAYIFYNRIKRHAINF